MERISPNEGKNFQKSENFFCCQKNEPEANRKDEMSAMVEEIRYLGKVGRAYKRRFNHASHKHPSESNHTSNLRKELMKY